MTKIFVVFMLSVYQMINQFMYVIVIMVIEAMENTALVCLIYFYNNFSAILDHHESDLLIGRGMSIIQRSTNLEIPGKQVVPILLNLF